MADGVSVEFKQEDPIKKLLESVKGPKAESALRKATLAGAHVVYDAILNNAPQGTRPLQKGRTSRLRDNLKTVYEGEDSITGMRATYKIKFTGEGWYARLLEFGTSKIPAKPFIRPAFDESMEAATQKTTEVLREELLNGV